MDIEFLRKILNYDPETGIFKWKARTLDVGLQKSKKSLNKFNSIYAGMECGYLNSNGYLRVVIGGKDYRLHRVAWALYYNYIPNVIDHINRIKVDNRIENLRDINHQLNNLNSNKRKGLTSKYKGVYKHKLSGKWNCQCMVNGKKIHVGVFDTEYQAHEAYVIEMKKHHGAGVILGGSQ